MESDRLLPARFPDLSAAPPLALSDGARIVAAPYFDSGRRVDVVVPPGLTVVEIIAATMPDANEAVWPWLDVHVDTSGVPLDPAYWRVYRPRAGATLLITARPGNRGVLRSVLAIGVALAAVAAGQFWAAGLASTLGVSTGVASGLISGAVGFAGIALINALVPIKKESATGLPDSPTYSTSGFSNAVNPDGILPTIIGRGRVALPYLMKPWIQVVGNDSFTRGIIGCEGPVRISDIRIGNTPIDKFRNSGLIRLEVREGRPDDEPFTIVGRQVVDDRSEAMGLRKNYADLWGVATRITARDIDSFDIELTFGGGMFVMITTGSGDSQKTQPHPITVPHIIRFRELGTSTWTEINWNVFGYSRRTMQFRYSVNVPVRGPYYEVQVERAFPDLDDLNQFNETQQWQSEATWTGFRCYRPEYPLNHERPIAGIAFEIRATEQLQGPLKDLNALVETIGLKYNPTSGLWAEGEIDNPADLMRHCLQAPQNPDAVSDAEIDLAQLQTELRPFCVTNDIRYFRVIDYETTPREIVEDICAAAYSAPRYDGSKWGVVMDVRKPVIVAMITSDNCWGFEGSRNYPEEPQGVSVSFYDRTNDNRKAERRIPAPWVLGTPTQFEAIELPGIVDPGLAYKHGRKRLYELRYRPDIYTCTMDVDAAAFERGDRVGVNVQVLSAEMAAGRVLGVQGAAIMLDKRVTMETGETYKIRFRQLNPDANSLVDSIVDRGVVTIAGEHDGLFLTGAGPMPAVGELWAFGKAARLSEDCLVLAKEPAPEMRVRVTLTNYGGEIFDLLDADTPPAWDGRVGDVRVVSGPSLNFSIAGNSQYAPAVMSAP